MSTNSDEDLSSSSSTYDESSSSSSSSTDNENNSSSGSSTDNESSSSSGSSTYDESSSSSGSSTDNESNSSSGSSIDYESSSSFSSSTDDDSSSSSNSSSDEGSTCCSFSNISGYESDRGDSCSNIAAYARPAREAYFIPTRALKLEKIATFSISLELWIRATVDITKVVSKYGKWRKQFREQIFQSVAKLPLPQCVQSRVEGCLCDMMNNVKDWIRNISGAVFSRRERKCRLFEYVGDIVWYSNGAINERETARNLLKSDGLSDFEKFAAACHYCFQEEVEVKWASLPVLVRNSDVVKDYAHFAPLIHYWHTFCVWKQDGGPRPTRPDQMIQNYDASNWPAIEFFFDHLNITEQVNSAVWLIENSHVEYQELILSKLNEIQRLTVYTTNARQMVTNYYSSVDSLVNCSEDVKGQNAISTWYEVRSFINQADFVRLLKSLLKYDALGYVLVEIWTSSSDDYKSELLNNSLSDFIERVLRWTDDEFFFGVRIEFLFAVLSYYKKMDTKKEIHIEERESYIKLCEHLVGKNDSESLSRLLNLGILNTERRTTFQSQFVKREFFKKRCLLLNGEQGLKTLAQLLTVLIPETSTESKKFARDLLLEVFDKIDDWCSYYPTRYLTGDVTPLNEFLAPFKSSYSDVVQEYKQNLVVDNIKTYADYLCWPGFAGRLDKILKDCGLYNINKINELRERLIFSIEGIDKLHNMLLSGRRIGDAKRILDQVLKSSKDKKKLKRRLLARLKEEKRGTVQKKKYSIRLSKLM